MPWKEDCLSLAPILLLDDDLAALVPDGGMLIQPPGNDEAPRSPGPGEDGNGRCDEQGGHEHHEGDADPEERKEGGSAEGKGDGGETECDEEEDWEEGEEKLEDYDGLLEGQSDVCVCVLECGRQLQGRALAKGETHKEKRPRRGE